VPNMQRGLRRNSVLVATLAVFFWWAFEFAKHGSMLRHIIPFGEDPYDAVSSYAVIAAFLLSLISLLRSYLPRRLGDPEQPIYTLRAQAAVPFCVFVTVSVELVAMARHAPMWLGAAGMISLLTLELSLILFAALVLAFAREKTVRGYSSFVGAASVWLGMLAVLAVYPEHLIVGLIGHLLTVLCGAIFLFAPVSALVKAWLPEVRSSAASIRPNRPFPMRSKYLPLALAASTGLAIGALAYVAEVNEDSSAPSLRQILFVGGVFIGLGASGLIIGFSFLGRLLGFVASTNGDVIDADSRS
jgi:hypothetical protein